jgi:hypothetical protein
MHHPVSASLAMKHALIALVALIALPARAASPEEDYLAARDAYIKQFAHSAQDDATLKAYERALADLQARLRRIIGPVRINGFPGDGKINLDALDQDDEGFGLLDGLAYAGADEKARVLVTTASLFDKWLAAHAHFWPESPLPQDMGAALKRDDFYTQAINNDAAVVTYAEVPVARPAWATFAFAVLDARTQDAAPPVPFEMIITVRRAERVFIVTAKTAVAAGPIAACEELHARLAAEAQAATDADQAADAKDAALHEKAEQLARKADRAYPDCFATQARGAEFFPALVKQAQGLIDALPAK